MGTKKGFTRTTKWLNLILQTVLMLWLDTLKIKDFKEFCYKNESRS